jgi:hypothetical protein
MSFDEMKEYAESIGIKVDGRWSEDRLQKEIDSRLAPEQEETVPPESKMAEMNDLALRIFEGQGSIPDSERVSRIVDRLKDKGYEDVIKHLDLPIDDLDLHLKRLYG